jgi:two-component system sensor histidine kinase TctE
MDPNPAGAGLGLAIVRDIALLHGAAIVLDNAGDGPGLKVTVQFPAAT